MVWQVAAPARNPKGANGAPCAGKKGGLKLACHDTLKEGLAPDALALAGHRQAARTDLGPCPPLERARRRRVDAPSPGGREPPSLSKRSKRTGYQPFAEQPSWSSKTGVATSRDNVTNLLNTVGLDHRDSFS